MSRSYTEAQRKRAVERATAWNDAHKEYRQQYQKEYRAKNREKALARSAAWAKANPERKREIGKAYYHREGYKHGAAATAKRRAAQSQRTPKWADLDAINFFYECRPSGCHVDHIIPLQGETVSGLHVVENLQWLPAAENIRKSNNYT